MVDETYRIFSASVPGTSHVRNGMYRQDRANYWAGDNALIAAVADGAGSAEHSAYGAGIAIWTAIMEAHKKLQTKRRPDSESFACILQHSVKHARQRLQEVAHRKGRKFGSYATTLLLVVQTENLIGAAQIGDGAVVISNSNHEFETFTLPQRGEYANQTYFLTSSDALDCLNIRVAEREPRYVAMFTDGIQSLVLEQPSHIPHRPFFGNMFKWLEDQTDERYVQAELAKLLRSPRVTGKTDDDLTLLFTIRN